MQNTINSGAFAPYSVTLLPPRVAAGERGSVVSLMEPVRRILALLLIFLLLSVEGSLQTSVIWNRAAAWTPWLRKIGPLSLADFIIIAVTLFTAVQVGLHHSVPRSGYLRVCALAAAYLGIGLLYNLFVYRLWKTFLYDAKAVLYLTVPYLFLYSSRRSRISGWFTTTRIFVYAAIAGLLDAVVVNLWGRSEYPSYFGLPALQPLLPLPVEFIGVVFAAKPSHKALFSLLLLVDLLNLANRLSFGSLFNLAAAVLLLLAVYPRSAFSIRWTRVLAALLAVNVVYTLLVLNPLSIPYLSTKAGGFGTRQIQIENAWLNAGNNIPGVIGKGLGSTWFEYVRIPEADIYSVGTSVGPTSEQAMVAPVKFVFNAGPPSLLHKWGVLGTVLLALFITGFYVRCERGIELLSLVQRNKRRTRFLTAVLLVSFVFTMDNFAYIGILKTSLMTSLLAFYVEDQVRKGLAAVAHRAPGSSPLQGAELDKCA